MTKDILSQYGHDSHQPQKGRAGSGGEETARDVHNYSPPKGPTSVTDPKSPGLHGTNHGHCGTQGKH